LEVDQTKIKAPYFCAWNTAKQRSGPMSLVDPTVRKNNDMFEYHQISQPMENFEIARDIPIPALSRVFFLADFPALSRFQGYAVKCYGFLVLKDIVMVTGFHCS